ncbi:MAG TPA: FecR domain-containing protein [Bryobacteraceae bacterium]|nr:FecR domain-containing protein [Bryobacteraceae bacterium]
MRNDYLWDGSGAPDPEVQQLEHLLSVFRSRDRRPHTRTRWIAIAAALVMGVAAGWLVSRNAPESWQVSSARTGTGRLQVGETLETGVGGHATLEVGDAGMIEVEANSRLRLERARRNEQRMLLEHGLIHAFIWAPPRSFVVDTPLAVATDLGCFYTLEVGKDGAGLLHVTAGWVSFEHAGRESFIPAGAACQTRPGYGPGTPYREEAPAPLRQALQDFDFAHGGEPALDTILSTATRDDAFTLWHLLTRCDPAQEPRVYDRLAALVAPPAGVTRDAILQGNRQMLDRWWDQLGLGDTGWWRDLERKWP